LSERAHATWGSRLGEHLRWLYPAGGDWMRDRSAAYMRDAELLGITSNSAPSTPGIALMQDGAREMGGAGVDTAEVGTSGAGSAGVGTAATKTTASAARAMSAIFPPEVDRVYVQDDLSIVSPGPLEPRLDARLRTMADVESRALASTYRVTQASVNRAMAAGETAESLRALLAEISLTGIPQPLDYLIGFAAARYGALRVGRIGDDRDGHQVELERGARTYVRSDDSSILGAVVVDHSLSALSLIRIDQHRAVSRFDPDVVFWALTDARYPAAAENDAHEIVTVERRKAARASATPSDPPAVTMINRLRIGGEPTSAENGQAWLERQLDVAIRGKVGLTVTVKMPNGSLVDFQLEPASVAGGRLRARDRKSDLERTLPLSSIAAISPATSSPTGGA
jgi:hypothetical protein